MVDGRLQIASELWYGQRSTTTSNTRDRDHSATQCRITRQTRFCAEHSSASLGDLHKDFSSLNQLLSGGHPWSDIIYYGCLFTNKTIRSNTSSYSCRNLH